MSICHFKLSEVRKRISATRDGFTLIELLVVVAILAVLAALLFPAGKSVMEKSKSVKCVGNLKALGMGVLNFANDNQGSWSAIYFKRPWYTVLNADYGIPKESFFCPAAKSPAFKANQISYGYNITLGGGAVNVPPKYRQAGTNSLKDIIVLADSIDTASQQYYIVNGKDEARIGSRHGGKANIFWGDGHISAESKTEVNDKKYWDPRYEAP